MQGGLQVQPLEDLLNYNNAGEIAIAIFIGVVEGLRMCMCMRLNKLRLCARVCVCVAVDMPNA